MTNLDVSGLYPDLKVTTQVRDDYILIRLKPDNGKGNLGAIVAEVALIGLDPNKYLEPDDFLGEVHLTFEPSDSTSNQYSADVWAVREIKEALDLFWEEIKKAIELAWNDKNNGKGWVE